MKKPRKKMNTDMKVFLIIAAVIVAALGVLLYTTIKPKSDLTAVAKLNDNVINKNEFVYYYTQNISSILQYKTDSSVSDEDFLNSAYGTGTLREMIKDETLNQTVRIELMLLLAKEEGFLADEAKIDEGWDSFDKYVDEMAKSYGMEKNELSVAIFGIDYKPAEAVYRDYLYTQQFMESKMEEIEIDEEELAAYYETNRTNFDTAFVSHILILCPEDATEDEVAEKSALADQILKRVNDGEDFAALVTEFSEDTSSVEKAGLYEVKHDGQMVEEFENWAFENDTGATGIIRTYYGFHIMRQDGMKNTLEASREDVEWSYRYDKYDSELNGLMESGKYNVEKKAEYDKL